MRPDVVELLAPILGETLARYLVPKGTTLLLAAIGLVLWVMVARGYRTGLSTRHLVGASLTAVVAGLLGARVFFLLQHLPRTVAHPGALVDLTGGTTSWGGYLFGMLGFFGYLIRVRVAPMAYADVMAASLGLGPVVSRWGCLLSGCCWGRVADLPWAIRFPGGSFAHAAQQRAGLLDPDALRSLPVHPVQIYASLAGLVVFGAASLFWRRFRHRPGLTFCFYWLVYGSMRFVTEFFRGDVPRLGPLALTLSQHLALVTALVAAVGLRWRAAQTRKPAPPGSGHQTVR
jgi:phosphatidylglycerol:prolipoprotein diacylglycerol transferase